MASTAFAINMADVTRYARSRRGRWISQVIYGQVIWNPLAVITLWDNRPAKFFAGLFFAFANIGTNVTGNSIPFANDLTGMFPKYINVRRGQFICAILGFVICPWQIQAKATRFLAFLHGY